MSHAKSEGLVDQVKERYGRIARESSSCCGPSPCGPSSIELGYKDHELASVPAEADLGLGCGAPVERLELRAGEVVLDLGSGPGLDAFVAARLVGPSGRVFGVDMTPEMLERARKAAAKAGFTNVEFREGRLESLPIEDGSIDAVTSNCVINLVPDKDAVFREVFRVLKPGGRLVISDIVLDGALPEPIQESVMAYVGCVSGALPRERYFEIVESVGLTEITILKDVDFLDKMGALPEEIGTLLTEARIDLADLVGKVRSITFRAQKPATVG